MVINPNLAHIYFPPNNQATTTKHTKGPKTTDWVPPFAVKWFKPFDLTRQVNGFRNTYIGRAPSNPKLKAMFSWLT